MWRPFGFITSRLDIIISNLVSIRNNTSKILFCLSKPGKLRVIPISERRSGSMADTIVFNVLLPPKSAPDVVARKLTVTVGDAETVTLDVSTEQISVDGLEGPEGSSVTLSLVDVDNAGLESQPSSVTVTLADTFPPPAPGQIGVVNVEEKF